MSTLQTQSGSPSFLFALFSYSVLVSVLILLAIGPSGTLAATFYVNAATGMDTNSGLSPTTAFKTITRALSVVLPTDSVIVFPGTYNTTLGEIFPIDMVGEVVLTSQSGAAVTIIDATGSGERVFNCTGNPASTVIRGFTITGGRATALSNGSNSVGGGMYFSSGDETLVENNIITRDTARGYHFNQVSNGHNGGNAYGGGIYISSAAPTIRNNIISFNVVMGGGGENWQGGFSGTPSAGGFAIGGGIAAGFANAMTVVNNTFYGNGALGGPGGATNNGTDPGGSGGNASAAGLDAGFNVVAFNNIFVSHVATGGTGGGGGTAGTPGTSMNGAVTAAQASQLSHNLYFNNAAQLYPDGAELGSVGNVFADPLFAGMADFHLASSSSPAFHTGTATGAPLFDFDGIVRGSPPSIGAYEGSLPTHVAVSAVGASSAFGLFPNFPNPFNPSTTISYSLEADGPMTLKVYDLVGREVATLAAEVGRAGVRREVRFDGANVSTGVYVVHLESGGKRFLRNIVLLR